MSIIDYEKLSKIDATPLEYEERHISRNGYNDKLRMSNNAVESRKAGGYRAVEIAKKLKIESLFIEKHFYTKEIHHYGKSYMYDRCYDIEKIRKYLKSEQGRNHYKWFVENRLVYPNSKVWFKEFEKQGIGRYSKYVLVGEYKFENIEITIRGKFVHFKHDGVEYKKKIDGKHFSYITGSDIEYNRMILEKSKSVEYQKLNPYEYDSTNQKEIYC